MKQWQTQNHRGFPELPCLVFQWVLDLTQLTLAQQALSLVLMHCRHHQQKYIQHLKAHAQGLDMLSLQCCRKDLVLGQISLRKCLHLNHQLHLWAYGRAQSRRNHHRCLHQHMPHRELLSA